MRINFENVTTGTPIVNIPVGEAFFAQRKTTKEKGLYMRIDEFSDLIKHKSNTSYAVDLASGQLREFESNTFVERVFTEVIFSNE